MKPTEAKEWIDEAVSLGANRTRATELLDAYTTQLGPILTPIACAATMALLKSMRADEPEVSVAELPPVEIPRRVVVTSYSRWTWYEGLIGTVHDISHVDDHGYAACTNGTHTIEPGCFIELQLTKEEQARLLLERLSREAIEKEGGLDGPAMFAFGESDECVTLDPMYHHTWGTPLFPSTESWSATKETIIRAGLAWWALQPW